MVESGYKGFEVVTAYLLMAPAKTPADVRTKWAKALSEIVQTKDFQAKLIDIGMEQNICSPMQLLDGSPPSVRSGKPSSKNTTSVQNEHEKTEHHFHRCRRSGLRRFELLRANRFSDSESRCTCGFRRSVHPKLCKRPSVYQHSRGADDRQISIPIHSWFDRAATPQQQRRSQDGTAC